MSIRNTILSSLFLVLGLFLAAAGWLCKAGMDHFTGKMSTHIRSEVLEQGAADFQIAARQFCAWYGSLPPQLQSGDPIRDIVAYPKEDTISQYLVFNAEGIALHPPDGKSPFGDLVSPALLKNLLSGAAHGEADELTVDNYQNVLEGREDTPAIMHLRAFPGQNCIVGMGRVQELAGIRLQSLSETGAEVVRDLVRRGLVFGVILTLSALFLAWLLVHVFFFRPLLKTFGDEAVDSDGMGAGLTWAQFKSYARQLGVATGELRTLRSKLEREVESRFKAEEERDYIRQQMDHALGRYEKEIEKRYARQLQDARSALMQREARALHRRLLEPLEDAWRSLAEHPGGESVRGSLGRCLAVVRGLLEAEPNLPHAPEVVSFQPWLQEAVSRFSHGHTVAVETNIDNGIKVNIDPGSLQFALECVMDNAFQASRPNGRITVDGVATEEGVEIRIVDRGTGISDSVRSHIMVPFYSDRTEGDGLGLAAAKAVIRQNAGTMRVQSEEEKGTAVVITLPRAGS